jgi:hypothetical protein
MSRVVPISTFLDSLNGKDNYEEEGWGEIEHEIESEDEEDTFLSIGVDFGTT